VLDYDALWRSLRDAGLGGWQAELDGLIHKRLSDAAHGDFPGWRGIIESLPGLQHDHDGLRSALLQLAPWRKGPFSVGGITIDSEWRSDLKWARVAEVIEPLEGRRVLDVGSGNGYYALRMRDEGAELVIGIDPTLLYIVQFAAIQHFQRAGNVYLLPLRLGELPAESRAFDATFSMGVLYHQRSPIDHLRQLRETLRPGGQLVLETLFIPGEEGYACTPPERYARMRNVWMLPTLSELKTWLARSGFDAINIASDSVTTTDEQRSTDWMPFESLAQALDPTDPDRTVEGWPAPRRVIAVAKSP
jgi:tRNA (mo5U34)-methyltransferase